MNRRRRVAWCALVAGAAAVTAHVPQSQAQASTVPAFSSPTIALDRYEVAAGDEMVVTIAGFQAPVVTVSICGNEARRGSVDCDNQGAKGVELDSSGASTVVRITVAEPPTTCPCIVRVFSPNQDEVAVVPFTLVGHAVGPVIGSEQASDRLGVALVAEPAGGGWVRSSLGGSKAYDVTVTVRNHSTVVVRAVGVVGSVGRSPTDVQRTFEFDAPASIAAGELWEGVVRVVLPAPVYGDAHWTVDVTSDGSTVTAVDSTSHLPGLLIVLILVLVADAVVLVVRFAVRRRRRPTRAQRLTARRRAAREAVIDVESTESVDHAVFEEPARGEPQPVA